MAFVDVYIEYKDTENNNLFTSILKETLVQGITGTEKSSDTEKYYILPFIKKTFNEDVTWLLELDSSTVVRYVHLFTHFSLCYAITQTLTMLSPKVKDVS